MPRLLKKLGIFIRETGGGILADSSAGTRYAVRGSELRDAAFFGRAGVQARQEDVAVGSILRHRFNQRDEAGTALSFRPFVGGVGLGLITSSMTASRFEITMGF